MIHQMVIPVLHAVFCKLGLNMVWQVELPVSFLVILFVSYLVYHYFESSLSNCLNRKII